MISFINTEINNKERYFIGTNAKIIHEIVKRID